MLRNVGKSVVVLFLVGGCSGKHGGAGMEAPKKPVPASQMSMFNDMIGSWTSTWEMTGEMAEEMKEHDPKAQMTFKGENTCALYMDGIWLKCDGWYEMGPDLRATYVEYYGYNTDDNVFNSYFISDMGEVGHGVLKPCGDDNRCFKMKWSGHDLSGNEKSGGGCMRFVDKDSMEFSWFEKMGPFAKMEMKGTSKRKK